MLRVVIFVVSFGLTWTSKWKKEKKKPKHTYLNGLKVLCRPGKDFLQGIHMHSFWLYPHLRLSTAILQLTTYCILLCFLPTVFPKLFLFSLSSSKIPQLPSLNTKPNGFKSSYNFLLILCLCPLYLSPSQSGLLRSLPHAEHWAHLTSISPLHYCYKRNHSPCQCATLSGRGAGLWPQKCCIFSLPHQPTLLCLLSCMFTAGTQGQELPSFLFLYSN